MRWIKFLSAGILTIGLVATAQAKVLYQEDFQDWRDENTNPGFNANFEYDKDDEVAVIKTGSDINFGKVMSAEQGITMEIDEDATLAFKVLEDIPKGNLKVHLMTAGEPYDSHEMIRVFKKGDYKVKLAEKTPWTGEHTFWLEMWVEGFDRTVKITDVRFTDGEEEVEKSSSKKTKKSSTRKRRR